jgi:DnaK suppressor protein
VTAAQRQKLKKLLLALRARLEGKPKSAINPNRASDEEVGGDEDEQPLNEMMQAIASNRNRNADGVIVLIDRALQKLQESPADFGDCEECGEEVGLGRLQAMPYARFCVGCQSLKDGPKGPATRRKLTDYR